MTKKNSLLITYGDGLGFAHRLKLEGTEPRVFFPKPKMGENYQGMAEKVESLNDGLDGVDNVIVDYRGDEKMVGEIIDAGYPVIGACAAKDGDKFIFDAIENDRIYAIEKMLELGIAVPETHAFDNAAKAINWLESKGGDKRWVGKPLGEVPKKMTLVTKDNESLKSALEGWTTNADTKNVKLILQEFIEGLEVNPEIYFSNGDPVLPATVLFEDKKFMSGNIGPAVGVASSTIFPYYGTKLIDQTLKKLYPFIKKTGYTGPADCNVIIDKVGKCWYLESGWRFGWSSAYAELALLGIPFTDFVAGLCDGTLKSIPWRRGYGCALRVTVPPYPFESQDEKLVEAAYAESAGIIIPGNPFKDKDTFPVEVYQEDKLFKTMGLHGVVCEVGGFSYNIKKLWANLTKKAKDLNIPDAQYRDDCYENVAPRIDKFFGMGYGRQPQ